MSYAVDHKIKFKNARIIYRNLEGKEVRHDGRIINREGKRNFCVIIDDADYAMELMEEGWNVKPLKKRDEDEDDTFFIQIQVNFEGWRAPKAYMVIDGKMTPLDEDTISEVDSADIVGVDVVANPYNWQAADGRSGVTAYLEKMLVIIEEDDFFKEYAEREHPEDDFVPFE